MSDSHSRPTDGNDEARFSRGGNNPPELLDLPDLATMLNPAVMHDQFDIDYAVHLARRQELLDGAERFFATVKKIETEEEAARAADFAGQMGLFWSDVEADRVREVRIFLDAQKAIQGWFKVAILDPIAAVKGDIERKLKPYAERKAADRRKQLATEAREAAAEAQKALDDAEASARPSQLEAAAKLAQASEQAEERLSKATNAGLGRVRGTHGTLATVRTSWEHELVDEALVPREWLMVDVAKVRQAIANGVRDNADGTPAIPGLKIFETSNVKVRA